MMLRGSISFRRKLFENDMYFIRTESADVVFHPRTVSENDIVTPPQEEGKDARTSIRSGRLRNCRTSQQGEMENAMK